MIGKQQNGIDTATESLALQNSGNSMIEHKKGLLQETLSDVFEYAIELALLNWNTTMLFRITGKNGEDDFESFNPDLLNRVPVMIESDTEYRNNYLQKNPDAKPEDYKYMQSEVRQAYADKAISKKEYRNYLTKQLGLNIQEIPESIEEQQELGIYDSDTMKQMQMVQQQQEATGQIPNQTIGMNQNAGIEGLTANGNVATSAMRGV